MTKKKKVVWSIAGIAAVLAARASLFRTIGIVFIEDLFALHLGSTTGFTIGNVILVISAGALIWYLYERKKK